MIKTNFQTIFPTVGNWILALCLAGLFVTAKAQKSIPNPPNPPRLVNDFVGMLSGGEANALERKLVAYNDSTSTQIAIVIERSLEGEDIFDYSFKLAEKWGIGGQSNDNGILIYIAQEDRKIRIQTGYGVEHFLPDVLAKRIIENIIVPAFRSGSYYQGLDKATDVIIELGSGQYQADEVLGSEEFPVGMIIFLILLIIIIIIIIKNSDSGGGYHRGGRYERDRGGWIIFGPGGGGWNSGGGGGFGGGGFGGFGGGSFGGGGAGGSW